MPAAAGEGAAWLEIFAYSSRLLTVRPPPPPPSEFENTISRPLWSAPRSAQLTALWPRRGKNVEANSESC